MARNAHRVTATHVGIVTNDTPWDERVCARCGITKRVNARAVHNKRWMCGDCKYVDPEMAKRIGA